MKIAILNGNPKPGALDTYLSRLGEVLADLGHAVTRLDLRDLDLRYCIGCFGCWVKTPGECVAQDGSQYVCRAAITSDFTLWAAPLHMGFPSAPLKMAIDKMIPLVHPYIILDQGEAHHLRRYQRYPRLGLLLEPELDTDETDLRIVSDVFSRTALNMKSRLEFSLTTATAPSSVARRILAPEKQFVRMENNLQPTQGVQVAPPSHLTLFNGSPRGRKGNTPIMLEQIGRGFSQAGGDVDAVFHLNRLKETRRFVQAFADAECAWLGFPLYTDAMPAIVKVFIEALAPLRGRPGNPPIGFLVQSGFPEALHSRHIERYLERLARRLGSPYLGTIVKGGGEGVRLMPESANQPLFANLQAVGRSLAESGRLDGDILAQIAAPERYPAHMLLFFQVFLRLPLSQMYWNNQLKDNGVYERRFARPYRG
jgi:multimeric flavodoxin WrbA